MRRLTATLMATITLSSAIAQQTINTPIEEQTAATRQLIERNNEFRHEIIRLADNVYTASGYDASNITMIIGDDGVVLIDAGKFAHNSERVYEEFRKITDKPITGIIFTHGHGDHTQGTPAFLKDNTPQIWAAESFGRENEFPTTAGFKNPRGHRQNGMTLAPEVRINNGVAPLVYPGGKFVGGSEQSEQAKSQYIPFDKGAITNFVSDAKQTINISGIELELVRTYGETADHLVIWYADKRIIFPGDQFYKSFPNLYAIRGTEYRDVLQWIEALNVVLEYPAEAMAQGHTRPIEGADNVRKAVTNMRDAVKFVFDKTIEGMNLGMTPDELVEYVVLPDHLANDPYLTQYYGRVEWAVRNIFNGYMGWYDGNPTTLCPLPTKAEAERFTKLAGGIRKVEAAARKAIKEGDYQWAAELSDRLIALEPANRDYRFIKAEALNGLADNMETATGRNFYNTVANELRAE
ncbi:MAG: alkyl/aryl-sulfatase [Rikenellaceae bacterium]